MGFARRLDGRSDRAGRTNAKRNAGNCSTPCLTVLSCRTRPGSGSGRRRACCLATSSRALYPLRALLDRIKRSERVVNTVTGRWMLYETSDRDQRAALLRIIFDRLRSEGRFDPQALLQSTWEPLEDEARKRFAAHA